jgi:hypothetical protein
VELRTQFREDARELLGLGDRDALKVRKKHVIRLVEPGADFFLKVFFSLAWYSGLL